ncbi:PspA/IM30 family protein [Paenibacillus sp. UNC451MF]|uniref:PspA/IM30 family protein n=1 Tax=Paenibacillus sp. UNC451MF TaxID=1449063 RepID=UPI00048F1AD6|nr:PspA/IM30 family protein [Paenibacillus sp. UNC451MF]
MGVLKRLVDMSKAAAHEALDKWEQPVTMLNQYLRDMEEEIHSVEQALTKQTVSERRLEQQKTESERGAELSERKAAEALAADRTVEARQAVEARLTYLDKAAQYAEAYEASKQRSAELAYQLTQAKTEYASMQAKRNELAARAQKVEGRTLGANKQVFSYGVETGTAARGFQRIEETIMQKEAQVELLSSMKAEAAASREALIEEQLKRIKSNVASS